MPRHWTLPHQPFADDFFRGGKYPILSLAYMCQNHECFTYGEDINKLAV